MARQAITRADLAFGGDARFVVSMVFYPPDGRRRDVSNLHAAMKAALDGIASAMGVDDSTFLQHQQSAGHVVKVALRGAMKGRVDVAVEQLQ